MIIFQAVALANPHYMRSAQLSVAEVRATVAPLIGFLISDALLQNMISELARYQFACAITNEWDDKTWVEKATLIEDFWTKHKLLPAWTEFAHLCMLLDPSSACVERAFSILKYLYGDQQSMALQDKIETALMLRCNRGLQRRHASRV